GQAGGTRRQSASGLARADPVAQIAHLVFTVDPVQAYGAKKTTVLVVNDREGEAAAVGPRGFRTAGELRRLFQAVIRVRPSHPGAQLDQRFADRREDRFGVGGDDRPNRDQAVAGSVVGHGFQFGFESTVSTWSSHLPAM